MWQQERQKTEKFKYFEVQIIIQTKEGVRKVDEMVEVSIYLGNTAKSGCRSLWAKELTGIDTTKSNGYAFQGRFLRKAKGKDGTKYNKIEDIVPEGAFVVALISTGSWNYPGADIVLFRAENGGLKEVYRNEWKPHKRALIIRDIAEIVGQRDEKAEIMQVIRRLVDKYGIDKVREVVEEAVQAGEQAR